MEDQDLQHPQDTLVDKFCPVTKDSHYPYSRYLHPSRRDKEVHIKIAATIVKVNATKDPVLEECHGGAEGGGVVLSASPINNGTLTRDLKLMYGADNNFPDLKLERKDHMTLSAHKFVLAARSPVFRKMIEDHVNKPGFSGTLKMTAENAKPLIVVLQWMYTDELHQNAGKVMEEVVDICVKFEIFDLLKVLDKKLITICTTKNMFQLFQIAQQNGMKIAMDMVSGFIKKNIGKVTPATRGRK